MTFQELKQIYKDVFYLEEDMILDVIAATTIATKLQGDPVWILIIGGPSSGKSELVNAITKVPFVFPISNMTENTFLSNMRLSDGKEASLLKEIGTTGMITMKDYTSILSMRPEKREIIVSQMREIYDGSITKRAGNGKSDHWEGKINWIGAVTDSVYLAESESAGMGRRTINYIMPEQDRMATLRRALKNNSDIAEKRTKIQDAFAEFVSEQIQNLPDVLPELSEEFSEELIILADFITKVRTPTERNKYSGQIVLVPSPEMGMRVFQMFQTLARVLVYMHKGENIEDIMKIMKKLAFDSIPKQTRLILWPLAEYSKLTTKGLAHKLNYPTDTIRTWLENINVLGICTRGVESGSDQWSLNEQYREIMTKYADVKPIDTMLLDNHEVVIKDEIQPSWVAESMIPFTDDPGAIKEYDDIIKRDFDSF